MPSPVSVHFSSVAQLCLTFCDPVDHRTPGFPSHHQLLELIQFHVHWVGDVIQPSHSLSSPSPPAFTLSHHQGLYQWVRSLHQVAKLLELQLQHQSWIFRTDFNHFQFTLIHEHNIPGSYAILFLTASVFTSITNHIHSWVFFSLWLCLFILSGVISPLFSRSILGTYWPGEVFFQCPVFLPFHTVHGVLKERILSGLPFPSPGDHVFFQTLQYDQSILGGPTWHGS